MVRHKIDTSDMDPLDFYNQTDSYGYEPGGEDAPNPYTSMDTILRLIAFILVVASMVIFFS
jgi:hypothetical protein